MTNFFYFSVAKSEPSEFTFEELLEELDRAAHNEQRARELQGGISSKEAVRTRRIEAEIRRRCEKDTRLFTEDCRVFDLMTRDQS